MAASIKRIFFRRQASDWFKTIALTIFLWFLIIYGFSRESNSNFGEHLDRNKIEQGQIKNSLHKETSEEISDEDKTTLDPKSELIFNAFLNKLSATNPVKVSENLIESSESEEEIIEQLPEVIAVKVSGDPIKSAESSEKVTENNNFTIKITKELLKEKLLEKQDDAKEVVLEAITGKESGEWCLELHKSSSNF